MYANQPMSREDAVDLVVEIGRALSARNADGTAIPATAKVGVRSNGDGFDACVPVELLHRVLSPNPNAERTRRISAWERLFNRKANTKP